MEKKREKAISTHFDPDTPSNDHTANPLLQELREARRAAQNLMEDAVLAREESERAMAALRKSEARHSFLLALSDELRSIAEPLQIQSTAARVLGKELGVDRAYYCEIDEEDGYIQIAVEYVRPGMEPIAGRHCIADFPWIGSAFIRGAPAILADLSGSEVIAREHRPAIEALGIRAFISVPLVKDSKLVAALTVAQAVPRVWTATELELVEETADRTWSAVEWARSEEARRKSEERMRRVLETEAVGVLFFDHNGTVIDANEAFLTMTGYTRRQVEDRTLSWRGMTPSEWVEQSEQEMKHFRRTGRLGPYEKEYFMADGSRRWMLFAGRDLGDGTISEYCIDITGRKSAEELLRKSEENYRTLFESIDEGFATIEVLFDDNSNAIDYRFLQVNPAFYRQTGILDAVDKRMREIAPEHEDYWFEIYGNVALTGEPVRFERYAAQLGRWYDVYAFRVESPDARRVGVLFKDVSERKRMESVLRESEERLRLVTESFVDFAIFTLDTEGIVQTWNPGAENIFGYTDSEIIGKSGRILFVPEDQAAGAPEHEMETARTIGRAADERWHLRKDETRFYASGIMAPLHDGDRLIGFAKIARDLTRHKQAEAELRRQHEELEAIVAGRTSELAEANEALRFEMAERQRIEGERFALLQKIVTTQEDERRRIARDMHDTLGQQLTAMRLKLASLKNEKFLDGRIAESLESLQEMGRRIDSEVNFLVWELRPTILDDLGLVAAIDNYLREWSRHVEIPTEFHAGRFPRNERLNSNIETNLYRITQEALNNVYKHAKAQSANVVLEMRKGAVVLVVEDDGIGFETDGRVRESGRGLGLVGMRERAAIIGGTIEIESAPGKGTTVFVRAPVRQGDGNGNANASVIG